MNGQNLERKQHRKEFEKIADSESGSYEFEIVDDTQPEGEQIKMVRYIAPFVRFDRAEDYKKAWERYQCKE